MAAAADNNAGGNDLAANRVPLFYGNGKDAVTPKGWIAKLDRLRIANGWTDQAALSTGANALRDICEEWFAHEIADEPTMSYEVFKTRFLQFTGASNVSYMGFTQMTKMTTPRGNDLLNAFYNRIMTSSAEWRETIPDVPVPQDLATILPATTRARPNISNLTAEDFNLLFQPIITLGQSSVIKHQAMSLFFNGLGVPTKEFLRDKRFDACRDMRNAVDSFESSRRDMGQPVNSIDDEESVDALRRQQHQQYRKTTGPPQSKGRPVECHYCKKLGHIQKDCRKRARDKAPLAPIPKGKVNSLETPDRYSTEKDHLNC